MIRFSKDKVLLLHKLLAEATGGSIGLRDEGLLESALDGIYSHLWGEGTLSHQRGKRQPRLGYTLISNHAFVDGNKRIGMYVMLTFLEVNGIRLNCSNEDVVEAGLGVAAGSMTYEQLLQWVLEHEA